MIRILIRDEQGTVRRDVQKEQLPASLLNPGNTLWVDLAMVSMDVVEPMLDGSFGFHPLAIDDALNETHVPKVDEWNGYRCDEDLNGYYSLFYANRVHYRFLRYEFLPGLWAA